MTQERLKQLLSYDPETGIFTNLVNRKGTAKAGMVAGSKTKLGYLMVTLDSRKYYLHRLAWLYVTGSMPAIQIDHADGDVGNNSITNLREATRSQNQCNRRPFRSTSGVRGVTWHKAARKWLGQFAYERSNYYVGLFENIHDAAKAVAEAREKLHGEFDGERRRQLLKLAGKGGE